MNDVNTIALLIGSISILLICIGVFAMLIKILWMNK